MKKKQTYDLFNQPPIDFEEDIAQRDDLLIHGLKYIPDFITINEEQLLIQEINKQEWLNDLNRRVQHYGWKYNYKSRSIDYSMYLGVLPKWIDIIAVKLFELNHFSQVPDQVIINEYKPGQGIANHIDCEPCFGDTIVSLSLAGTSIMNFVNIETNQRLEKFLERRSLIVIKGESRYKWTHGIPPRLTDKFGGKTFTRTPRISLTFRSVVLDKNSTKH